jgi:hypothetical protein
MASRGDDRLQVLGIACCCSLLIEAAAGKDAQQELRSEHFTGIFTNSVVAGATAG